MKLKRKIILVHDVWDGKLTSELEQMSLGLTIVSTIPGTHKKSLSDYIRDLKPIVVFISIPCFDWPLVHLYDRCLSERSPPQLFVVNKKYLITNDQNGTCFGHLGTSCFTGQI